jgi:uncharacterized protein YcbK (DUF882 family)
MKFQNHAKSINNAVLHNRREFLKLGAIALAVGLSGRAFATSLADSRQERHLSFYNIHTGEQLKGVYWAEGRYQPEALAEINYLLRDYRSGDISPINIGLLDLLYTLSASLETNAQFHVISGYRSPATNALLAENSSGVAKHSLHMDGLAIDIRLPGRDLTEVHRAAIALQGGGVGFYPASNFVHMDVGRVRTW